ncbi:ABC transporter permease subunit [Elioraea tepidiphila]|uniref:ABC transporter permease subunit n=1 Tax=Elioraea tepidiphila TaxID=457934 RepID=UPI00037709B8|nr:ABC transporter permease subunit [Elioraea tepidiphila]
MRRAAREAPDAGRGGTREGDRPLQPAVARFVFPDPRKATGISLATILALLALWWLATARGWIAPLFLASPGVVLDRLIDGLHTPIGEATLIGHSALSLLRVMSAFGLACLTAIPAGIAMGVSRVARGVLDPPIEFYRPLPPLAYLPLVVIWFGIDEASKIVLIYLACFAPLAIAARAGVRSVAPEQVNAALSLGATRVQLVRYVIVPAALPDILTGMRIALGFGWTTLVAAEMVAANVGLGQMVLNASNFLRTDLVMMGIVVIAAFAYAFDLGMRAAERRLVPWKGRV